MPSMLAEALETLEAPFEAGSDRAFLLSGGGGWLVHSGRLDVFSVPLRDGAPAGTRTHLFRAEQGTLVLGLDGSAQRTLGFLAVGNGGTRLLRLEGPVLRELVANPGCAVELAALLEGWVDLLYSAVTHDPLPEGCVELTVGDHASAGGRLRPANRISWVRTHTGRAHVLGRRDLALERGVLLPLARRAWLEVPDGSRLHVQETPTVLGQEEVWAGLGSLHDLVLGFATQISREAVAAERERLRLKAGVSFRAFSGACQRLADTLTAARPHARASGSARGVAADDDPLFRACSLVGTAAGLELRAPSRSATQLRSRDPVAAIAQASRLRVRQVVLREGWWREDAGPFLAQLESDRRPIALLPTPRRGYELHDPVAGTSRPVDAALAETIAPQAFTFYRPFADRAIDLRELLRFGMGGCGRDALMVIVMSTATGLLSLVTPIATGLVFNDIIPGANRPQLLQLTLGLVVIALATALFNIVSAIAVIRVEARMGVSTQAAVWDRLLALPLPFFRPYASGELATRAMGHDAIRQVVSGSTVAALIGGITSMFHFGLLFHYSSHLAWWASLIIGVAVALVICVGLLQIRKERAAALVKSRLAGTVLQFLTAVSKLRVAGAEAHAFALWAGKFSEQRRLQLTSRTIANVYAAVNAALPLAANVVLYALALPLLLSGTDLGTGDFLAFMASFGTCLGGMVSASVALLGMVSVVPLYEQARPILRELPEVDGSKADPGVLSGDVEVQRVSFRYQEGGPLILRDVSLHVHAGEFVAFVGPSGSGKSTMLRLLLGFEWPETGGVYYDAQDLAGLDRQAVRRQIGVVLQGGRLMSGDIYTNIVGSSIATVEDAWEAARMAGLEEDVQAMPMGMHTVISEGASTLSGGQRQRLMIARALINRPRLILFDEATSALDNRTQDIVSASLERLKATRIVIAHRLSTILHADRIFVFQQGRIVETGTYDELFAANGLFTELARRQLA